MSVKQIFIYSTCARGGWVGIIVVCTYICIAWCTYVCDLQVQQLVDSMSHCMPARGRRRKRRREEEGGGQ